MPAISLLVTVLSLGSVAAAQAPAGAASPLAALDFLVGACWSGQGPRGETDRHCFARAMGHFVRDVHETTGLARPYGGETIYHWDAKAGVVRFTYWNTNGGVSTGTMLVQDGALVFPEMLSNKDGTPTELRSVWTREGADAYVAKTEIKKDDNWTEMFRIVYKRVANPGQPR